ALQSPACTHSDCSVATTSVCAHANKHAHNAKHVPIDRASRVCRADARTAASARGLRELAQAQLCALGRRAARMTRDQLAQRAGFAWRIAEIARRERQALARLEVERARRLCLQRP